MREVMDAAACRVSDATRAISLHPRTAALRRFATVERILTVLCVTIPAWLILFDERSGIRSSISDYYDMEQAQAYYFPLTVAAMAFFFNGTLKSGRAYNIVLGLLLAGAILVDHDGSLRWLHIAFAIGFFGLNALVVLWFSQDVDRWLRVAVLVVAVGTVVAWATLDWVTVFVAEWVSLGLVSLHFYFDSVGFAGYSTDPNRRSHDRAPGTPHGRIDPGQLT